MPSFGEHAEPHIVLEYLYDEVLGFHILQHIPESVSLTDHRQYAEEMHDSGQKWRIEHVGSGSEHCSGPACTQDYQRIHQSVAMVRRKNDRTVRRKILFSSDLDLSVAVSDIPVHCRLEDGIYRTLPIYIVSFHLILLQFPFCLSISIRMQE